MKIANLFFEQRKLKKEFFAVMIFAMVIAAFYGNTLKNSFVHDEVSVVAENLYVHSLKYLPRVFTGCIWEYTFNGCKGTTSYYRPMQSLSYLLTYQISSKPGFFHLVNIFYFFIAGVLVFILIRKLTKNFIISFLTALIFLIHPINSEVGNWISTAPELLYAIFSLLSLLYFLKYRETGNKKNFVFCAFFYFLAVSSKEPAFLLPVIFAFFDWKIFKLKIIPFEIKEKPAPEKTASETDFDFDVELNWERIKEYGVFFLIAASYVLARIAVLGSFSGPRQLYFGVFSLAEWFYAFITLFGGYLAKLFWPYPLLFFYPFVKSADFFAPKFIVSFLATIFFFAAIFFLLKRNKNLRAIFLFWIFVFLFPILYGVYFAGENVFSERYLFVPSIGFAFLLSTFFYDVWQKRKQWRIFLLFLVFLLVIVSWLVVFPRNRIFKDEDALYQATLALNPRAYVIRRIVAVKHLLKGELEEARKEFETIIQMEPHWWEIDRVYNHLGEYYQAIGDVDKAAASYEQAINAAGTWTYVSYNSLGKLFFQKGEPLKSLIYFCQGLQFAPQDAEINSNFNRMVSFFDSVSKDTELKKIYAEIIGGETFSESQEGRVRYLDRRCQDDSCVFAFVLEKDEKGIVLPFLILASGPKGEVLKIKNRALDPQTGVITLELPAKYKEENLSFIFPACEGVYYSVEAPAPLKSELPAK